MHNLQHAQREILEIDEWNKLTTYLRTNKYLKPEGSSPLEQINR
jgi:hypothetical protein